VGVDVTEDMAHGALEHEATKTSRVVAAAVENGLHRVGDGIHHRVHGRNRGRHFLPSGNETSTNFSLVFSFPIARLVRTRC
jgi:hypothetical protein